MSTIALRHIHHWISRTPLEIVAWFQRTTIRKWPMGNPMFSWSRDRWRHVTMKGQVVTNTLKAQYLENSWRCYLATIGIYWIVCWEAIRSAILATAWLLVRNDVLISLFVFIRVYFCLYSCDKIVLVGLVLLMHIVLVSITFYIVSLHGRHYNRK